MSTSEQEHSGRLFLQGPCVEIANSSYAPNSLGAIALRPKLAAKVADVKVDASIEGRELPVENLLYQRLSRQDLTWSFEKRAQKIEFRRRQPERLPAFDTVRDPKSSSISPERITGGRDVYCLRIAIRTCGVWPRFGRSIRGG